MAAAEKQREVTAAPVELAPEQFDDPYSLPAQATAEDWQAPAPAAAAAAATAVAPAAAVAQPVAAGGAEGRWASSDDW